MNHVIMAVWICVWGLRILNGLSYTKVRSIPLRQLGVFEAGLPQYSLQQGLPQCAPMYTLQIRSQRLLLKLNIANDCLLALPESDNS